MRTRTKQPSSSTRILAALCACLLTAALAANAQIDRAPQNATRAVALPACKVSVTPSSSNLRLAATQQFRANVPNAADTAIVWSMDPSTGALSSNGLYTAPSSLSQTQTVHVTATSVQYPKCRGNATVTITVPLTVSVSPASAQVTTTHSLQLTATSNSAVTWTVSGVPGGNASFGAITSAGLYTAPVYVPYPPAVTVTATSVADPAQSASSVLQIVTEPTPLAVLTSSLPAGAVGASYKASVIAAGGASPYGFSLAAGQLPTGLSLSPSGALSGSPTASGAFNFTVRVSDAAAQTASQAYAVSVTGSVSIVTTSLPDSTVGTAYSATLVATGGTAPYVFSVPSGQLPGGALSRSVGQSFTLRASSSSRFAIQSVAQGQLPAGLSLSPSGTLAGTPAAAGASSFTIQVTDAGGKTASRSFTNSTVARLSIATSSLPNGTVGSTYSATAGATGGTAPFVFSLASGQLPAGLALNTSGTLSGTPAAAGTSSFTIQARDAVGATASQAYSVSVAAAVSMVTTSLPGGTLGKPYSATVTATGGAAPYAFSVAGGQLPAGLTLSTSGGLSGTPAAAGASSFTIQVADAGGKAASRAFTTAIVAGLSITTSSLPAGTVGSTYSATVSAAGGTAPYTFSVAAGQLPAGLTLNTSGTLSGTPSAAGSSSFTLQVTDAGGKTASRAFTTSFVAGLSITTSSLPNGTVGSTYSATVGATGGTAPYTFSVAASQLPAGLTLSASGSLSGTPAAAGASSFTIQARDAVGGTASQAYSVSVAAAVSMVTTSLPGGTVGTAYGATVTATGGTAPYAFSVAAGQLPAGLSLNTSGTLAGTPAAAGSSSFTIQVTDAGGKTASRAFTTAIVAGLSITTSSLPNGTVGTAYSTTVAATGGTAPYAFSLAAGQLPAGLSLNTSGTLAGTPSAAASSSFTLQVTDAGGKTASRAFTTAIVAGLSITTSSLPAGTVATAYSATVSATGGTAPYTFSLATGQLPAGLTLSASGSLSGTPAKASSFSFTIQARDAASQTATQAYSVSVASAAVPVSIVTTSLPGGTVGSAYSATVSASGGTSPYTLSLATGQLPAGLTLSASGSVSGTPTTAGSSSFTIQARDSAGQTASQSYAVSVIGLVSIVTTSLPDGVVGISYSTTVAATGGTAPYTYGVGLPQGLSISATTGQISGAPTTDGTYNVTVEATDAGGRRATKTLSLVIAAALAITTTSLPSAAVSVDYNGAVTAIGGIAPLTWAIDSGQLPPGLSLDSASGAITGRPVTGGTYSFSAQVLDSRRGQEARRTLTIGVTGPGASPAILTTSLRLGYMQQPYTAVLTASGGTAPYTWVVASGQLPPGLLLRAASGEITGTPTASGSYTFTAQVNDSASPQQGAAKTLTLEISSVVADKDQYGGLLAMASPGGKSGGWAVEKYPTADGGGRWLITTPDGHGLWCGMQFGIGKPTSLNVTAKYGSELNWQTATLARYTGWGFNCLAEYTDVGLIAAMNAGSLGKRVPYFSGDHYVLDAVYRREMITGQALPADAVKDLAHTAAKITNYTHEVADGFDPNFAPFVAGFAAARVADTDIYAQAAKNPWNVAMSIDDADYMYGFGPGPDDCTTPDGVYHAHIGWMALASPLNLYAQWYDTGNPYHGWNWIFNDTKVYSKTNLVAFLKTRYGNSISALNAAWGSTYTAFDSAATRYANETVGTTDGVVGQLQHTLAHPGVSPASLLIKVDGVPMATDPPRNPGTIAGKWPDGVTRLGGTINYSTGVLTLSSSASVHLDVDALGTTSWGTVDLQKNTVSPGSIVLRLMPADCRLADDLGSSSLLNAASANCPTSHTVSGTIDHSAGTIASLTITPAIPSNQQVEFQYTWTSALPGTHTVTVDYDVSGFGVGTTLADEDGSHTAWLGSTEGLLRKAQVPLPVWTDLSAWLGNYTEAYFSSTIDALRPYFPGKLITAQMSGLGGHAGCPRKEMAIAAANHSDFLPFSQITQPLLDKLVTWGLGDFPVMYAWEGFLSQADSPFSAITYGGSHDLSTQELRGVAMATQIGMAINGRGTGGTSYQIIGAKFWAYSDTTGESANFGLVSPSDNAYDGVEAKTGSHACSPPLQAYTCGGEAANYGDAVTAVRNALAAWTTKVR